MATKKSNDLSPKLFRRCVMTCVIAMAVAHAAQADTIRLRLPRTGAIVRVSAHRIWISMSSSCPWRSRFEGCAGRLIIPTPSPEGARPSGTHIHGPRSSSSRNPGLFRRVETLDATRRSFYRTLTARSSRNHPPGVMSAPRRELSGLAQLPQLVGG